MALYSACTEDRDIVVCFLVFQEMGLPPKVMKYSMMDRRVMGHAAQLESQ